MAAPHVSGLLALMISADLQDGVRDLDVNELQYYVTYTSRDKGVFGPDDVYGYGVIDALKAVKWVLSSGELGGTVRDQLTSAPIGEATISATRIPDYLAHYNLPFSTLSDPEVPYSRY